MQKEMKIYVVTTTKGAVVKCFYSQESAEKHLNYFVNKYSGEIHFTLQESVVELQESEGE